MNGRRPGFRGARAIKNVGWAPLPPEARFEKRTGIKHWADSYYDIDADEYVFVPNEDIGDENIQRAVMPEDRNVTIVNETTNVTNITYNNTTIVNEGPNFDRLRGRSRRPVERLHLQREYNVEREENPRAGRQRRDAANGYAIFLRARHGKTAHLRPPIQRAHGRAQSRLRNQPKPNARGRK